MEAERDLASLFEIEPQPRGSRGDPRLWAHMASHFEGVPLPAGIEELANVVATTFGELTGHSIDEEEHFYMKRYDHGGMSQDMNGPKFWKDQAIPFLQAQHEKTTLPSQLIIEDGTGVPSANSYQSLDDFRLFARMCGESVDHLPDSDAVYLMLKAMSYIESKADLLKGSKVRPDQTLEWPRKGAVIDNLQAGMTKIPREARYGQLQLAIRAYNNDLHLAPGPIVAPVVTKKSDSGSLRLVHDDEIKQPFTSAYAGPEALLSALHKRNGLRGSN